MRFFLIGLAMLLGAACLPAQIQWQRSYGGPFDDACDIHALPDGGFIFTSSINSFNSWLVRTDAQGDTVWTRTIAWADFCAVIPTHDGGFFLGGTTRTAIRKEIGYKVDMNGDSLWAYVYPDNQDHGLYRVEETAAHFLLMTGYASNTSGNYDMWVRQLDETGTSLWTSAYGTPNPEFGAMPALCDDGGYLFATTLDSGISRFIFMRTDPGGQVLWTQRYSPGYPCGGPVPTALPDGGFLIMGWIQLPGNNYNSFLLRTDSLGQALWARHYGGLGFEDRSARGIIRDLAGGYTFATMTDQTFGPGFDRDIALYHLDSLGDTRSIRRIGYAADDVPRYFAQSPDTGYALLGYSQSFQPNSYQVYLAKVAHSGCDQFFYWPGFAETDTICPGDSLQLDAGAGFLRYEWSNGDSTQRIYIQGADTVHVKATDAQGCVHYSNYCRVFSTLGPSFAWLGTGLQVQFDGNLQGDWDFGDGNALNANDPTHTYAQAGSYAVCLRVGDPHCGLMSFCDTITVVDPLAVDLEQENELRVAPQPASHEVELRWAGASGYVCHVHDVAGRKCGFGETETALLSLDLSNLPAGIYFLRCVSEDGETCWRRCLKQ